MSGLFTAAVVVVVLGTGWGVAMMLRSRRISQAAAKSAEARAALIEFAEQSLALESVEEILDFAGQAARAIFRAPRAVAFRPEDGGWLAVIVGEERQQVVDASVHGMFAWFKHNRAIAAKFELREARFGAMRNPLNQVMDTYGFDVILPLVRESKVLGVMGVALGRPLAPVDRDLMHLFRLQVTAVCANVQLHREAARVMSLAREKDLVSAVELALVPSEKEGVIGGGERPVRWAGYFQAGGDSGSDFWATYDLGGGRVLVLIGDAVGAGLAGAMVSAVVKSCGDSLVRQANGSFAPDRFLGALNQALFKPDHPVHARGFAVVIDRHAGLVHYANAANSIPYHIRSDGSLSVLAGSGPLLGDSREAVYYGRSVPLSPGDALVLFTDGLVNARNLAGGAFGDRRLQRILLRAQAGQAVRPEGIRASILESFRAHSGSCPLSDDAAVLVVSYG